MIRAYGAAETHDDLLAVVVVEEEIARKNFRADERCIMRVGVIRGAGKKSFAGQVIGDAPVRGVNVEPRPAGDVEIYLLIQTAPAVLRLNIHAVHDLHHLREIQSEPVDSILALEPDHVLDGIVFIVIGEKKNGWEIIEPEVVLGACLGVTNPDHDRGLDRGVKIGDPQVMGEIDVVIVDTADGEAELVMETARDSGIKAGGG